MPREGPPTEKLTPPRAAAPGFSLRIFESLKVRDFRFYAGHNVAQMAGMNMQFMVNGWFAYRLSGSAAVLGLVTLGMALPTIALSPFGGIIADRIPKKHVILLGQLAFIVLSLWIAVSISLDIITWPFLVANSFIQGVVFSLVMPSRQSIIPEIVGREHVTNAVAINVSIMNITQIGAPAIAGYVVAGIGVEGVYYLAAALQLIGALLLLLMSDTTPLTIRRHSRAGIFQDMRDGLAYLGSNRIVLTVLLLSFISALFSMPFRMLLPVFTEDIFKVGPEKLGLLLSVSGAGALAGSFFIASLGNRHRGMLFLQADLVTGLSILAFTLSTSYPFSLGVMAFTGLGQAGRMALGQSLLQSYTEGAYLGRVMSLFTMQMGVTSLGTFIASIVAEFFGPRLAIGTTAVLLVLITLYYYAFYPRLRRLD